MNECQKSRDEVRVCLASLDYYPLYSGATLRFHRYAPGLAHRGVGMSVFTREVTALTATRHGLLENHQASNGKALRTDADGLRVQQVKLPEDWRFRPMYFRKLANYCEKRRDEVEVERGRYDLLKQIGARVPTQCWPVPMTAPGGYMMEMRYWKKGSMRSSRESSAMQSMGSSIFLTCLTSGAPAPIGRSVGRSLPLHCGLGQ